MRIETFIKEKLAKALPSVPVYPVFAPEHQPTPFAVYQKNGTDRSRVMPHATGCPTASFSVTVYTDTYIDGKEKCDCIRLVVDNFTGTYGIGEDTIEIMQCYLVDEADGAPIEFEGESKPAYAAETSFTIKYRELASNAN
jgi:hypothetical protein